MTEDVRIEFATVPDAAERQFVINSLDTYNVAVTGVAAFYPVNLFLRAGDGELLGGLIGFLWGGWLQVQNLWVAEPMRRRGHAGRLMEAAELYARRLGCVGATLETHSFQARPFYEARGYVVFGVLEDYPPGHVKYFLRKALG